MSAPPAAATGSSAATPETAASAASTARHATSLEAAPAAAAELRRPTELAALGAALAIGRCPIAFTDAAERARGGSLPAEAARPLRARARPEPAAQRPLDPASGGTAGALETAPLTGLASRQLAGPPTGALDLSAARTLPLADSWLLPASRSLPLPRARTAAGIEIGAIREIAGAGGGAGSSHAPGGDAAARTSARVRRQAGIPAWPADRTCRRPAQIGRCAPPRRD